MNYKWSVCEQQGVDNIRYFQVRCFRLNDAGGHSHHQIGHSRGVVEAQVVDCGEVRGHPPAKA